MPRKNSGDAGVTVVGEARAFKENDLLFPTATGRTMSDSTLSRLLRGSHHLFDKEGIVEIINIQSRGGQAKPHQVRQVRNLILKYKLGGED